MLRKIILVMLLVVIVLAYVGRPMTADANQCSVAGGQLFIDAGQYMKAVKEFTCVIDSQPTEVEGYRGRIEAELLLGRYSDAVLDYAQVMRVVLPGYPDAETIIYNGYDVQLALDPNRVTALAGGLDTPRVQAILGAANNALGNTAVAAGHIMRHFDLVTAELVAAAPMAADMTYKLDVVPGRVYEIPLVVTAGEVVNIATSSKDYWDTILIVIGSGGTPVIGSDDTNGYFAAIDWTAEVSGMYKMQVTFFESASFGELVVVRD